MATRTKKAKPNTAVVVVAKDEDGQRTIMARSFDAAGLQQALDELVKKVGAVIRNVVDDATVLEVRTFAADGETDLTKVKYDASTRKFESTAEGVQVELRALTAIEFDGDINTVLPYAGGRLDTEVWQIHQQMVTQAQKNRADTIAALAGLAQQIVS